MEREEGRRGVDGEDQRRGVSRGCSGEERDRCVKN
jgi:hypothetical protein